MDKQEIIEILCTQSVLGRTKSGWDLGKGMLEASSGSAAEIDKDGFMVKECINCETMLSAELFAAGCPNCGCKDHKTIEVGTMSDSTKGE